MNHQIDLISSKKLFELDHRKEFSISKDLLNYLILHNESPWSALGKNLVDFLLTCVSKIPKHERILGSVHHAAIIENPDQVFIGEGAIVEPTAYIIGPAYIEPHAEIRHGAYVRGPVYVSSYSVIGHSSECKGSILLPYAKAAHFNYVGDSILGYNCNLGAGTKLANLKHNHSKIVLKFGDKHIETNLKKFGALIGNRVSLGCNSVANPGTIFAPDTVLNPNQTAIGLVLK